MARDTVTVNTQPLGPPAIRGKTASGRPILQNADGSHSTELLVTFPHPTNPKVWVNFPSLFQGKQLSEDHVRDLFLKHQGIDPETGQDFSQTFSSLAAAEQFARQRSRRGGANAPR